MVVQSTGLTSLPSKWSGFKIVGENVDKNVKPRFMRQGRSYVEAMEAVASSLFGSYNYIHNYNCQTYLNLYL